MTTARRALAGLVAAALLPVTLGASPAAAGAVATRRLSGSGRVETAVAVSAGAWETAADVVLATAGNFPDALAAGALAASLDAPLLLTGRDELPAPAAAELDRLGAERVHVLGGEAAVGPAVVAALEASGIEVRRISGPDRFATAAAAARAAGAASSGDVLLALGEHPDPARAWPDALSAGAYTAIPDPPPLLLTGQATIPPATEAALAELVGPNGTVHVVGGAAAVTDAVLARLTELGYAAFRVSGPSRFATSVATASDALRRLPSEPRPVILASGGNFPDGLAAAALAARIDALLLLVPTAALADSPATASWLEAAAPSISDVVVIGGSAAVSPATEAAVAAALDGPAVALPAPAALPAGAPSQVADALATSIAVTPAVPGAEDADPSQVRASTLATALAFSGFTVLDSTGALVAGPSGPDQGIVVEAWQVAALAEGATAQLTEPMSTFLEQFAVESDLTRGIDLAGVLQEDVRAAAADPTSRHHQWALLLAALGRAADEPHDLLADDPSTIRLTFVQLALLFTTLAADVRTWAGDDPADGPVARAEQAPPAARPCKATPNETEDVILTYGSAGYSYGYGKLIELLDNAGIDAAGRFANGTFIAGLVLSYLQTAITLAAIENTAAISPELPTRTKSHEQHGDPADFIGKVTFTLTKPQLFDCLRLVLRAMNLDFDLPEEGGVSGAEVRYSVQDHPGATPDTGPFLTRPGESGQERLTDATGATAPFQIIGRKQPFELSDEATQELATFDLKMFVQVEANDLVKDIPSVLSDASGGEQAVFTLPATMVRRSEWANNTVFTVEYLDWRESCEAGSSRQQVCAAPGLNGRVTFVREWEFPGGSERLEVVVDAVLVERPGSGGEQYDNQGGSTYTATYTYHAEGSGNGCRAVEDRQATGSGGFQTGPPTFAGADESIINVHVSGDPGMSLSVRLNGTQSVQITQLDPDVDCGESRSGPLVLREQPTCPGNSEVDTLEAVLQESGAARSLDFTCTGTTNNNPPKTKTVSGTLTFG